MRCCDQEMIGEEYQVCTRCGRWKKLKESDVDMLRNFFGMSYPEKPEN